MFIESLVINIKDVSNNRLIVETKFVIIKTDVLI